MDPEAPTRDQIEAWVNTLTLEELHWLRRVIDALDALGASTMAA